MTNPSANTDGLLSDLPAGSAVAAADLFYSVQGGLDVQQPASALATFAQKITGGTSGDLLYNNAGVLGDAAGVAYSNRGLTFSGTPTTLTINPTSYSQALNQNASFDLTLGTAFTRYNMFQAVVSPSGNTANVFQNLNSFVTVNGPGVISTELDVVEAYLQMNAGSSNTGDTGMFEASVLNSGNLNNIYQFQGKLTNDVAGTITGGYFSTKFQLTNNNATPGSVALCAALDMEPMLGSGSTPTLYYVVRNAEPNAQLATVGNVAIGTLSTTTRLYVKGKDAAGGTTGVQIDDSNASTLLFIQNDGTHIMAKGPLKLGFGGNWGRMFLGNTTSGAIAISPPSSGALGNPNITVPIPSTSSDTFALLGTAQTFSATVTFPDAGAWSSTGISATNVAASAAGSVSAPPLALTNFETGTGWYPTAIGKVGLAVSGVLKFDFGITTANQLTFDANANTTASININSNSANLRFGSGTNNYLTAGGANGALQLGQNDAAAPVAQTIQAQSVVAGTTNTAGQNATIIGSRSTGSGTSGDIIIQTGGTGAGSTSQNAAVTALTIKGATQVSAFNAPVRLKGYTVGTLPAGTQGDTAFVTDATGPTFLGTLTGGGAVVTSVFYNGSTWVAG